MRRASMMLLLAVIGCDRGGLQAVTGSVKASEAALHFDRTYLGFPTQRAVLLENSSRADRVVGVTCPPPFSAPAEVTVPGGSQLQLVVGFDPREEGSASGTLTLADGLGVLTVALDGEGLLAPRCVAS